MFRGQGWKGCHLHKIRFRHVSKVFGRLYRQNLRLFVGPPESITAITGCQHQTSKNANDHCHRGSLVESEGHVRNVDGARWCKKRFWFVLGWSRCLKMFGSRRTDRVGSWWRWCSWLRIDVVVVTNVGAEYLAKYLVNILVLLSFFSCRKFLGTTCRNRTYNSPDVNGKKNSFWTSKPVMNVTIVGEMYTFQTLSLFFLLTLSFTILKTHNIRKSWKKRDKRSISVNG